MKRIIKKEPDFYKEVMEDKKPRSWEELKKSNKKIGFRIRKHMLEKEQNSQCAYTEIGIAPEDSHIDHFKKQSLFVNLIFDWNNLLTSCNCDAYGARFKDKKLKKKEVYDCLINPVTDDPKEHFEYSITGKIATIDKNDNKAKTTIDLFNLNDKALVERRKNIIVMAKVMSKELSVDELVKCIGSFESIIRALYTDLKKIED